MSKHCPKCDGYMYLHENSDEYFCTNCSYDEHYENAKDEVLWLIEHTLSFYESYFTIPNGSSWTKEEIMKFLRVNLK